jgi:hypothetical protein
MKCIDESSREYESRLRDSNDSDPAEILARYWNERATVLDNIETISWWLRQPVETDPGQ